MHKFFPAALATLTLILGGCASSPIWNHPNISDASTKKRQLTIDDGNCTLISMGAAPIPAITASDTPKTTNYTLSGSSFNPATGARTYGTYSGQATTVPSGGFAGGFASGVASGTSLGAAIAAQAAQEKIYTSCMYSKGWIDTSKSQNQEQISSKQSVDLPAPIVYSKPEDEWESDTIEFFQFYPAYRTGEYFKRLNQRVKELAGKEPLNGPQYLVKALDELLAEGKVGSVDDADPSELRKLYRLAVAGDPKAQAGMGLAYVQQKDKRTPLNENRSAHWSRKAALQGNPAGQIGYGLMIFNGFVGVKNKVNGYLWVKRAESQGLDVRGILSQFESEMSNSELASVK